MVQVLWDDCMFLSLALTELSLYLTAPAIRVNVKRQKRCLAQRIALHDPGDSGWGPLQLEA